MNQTYKYLAFISYKHEDEKYAKKLQYWLEHYKLPSTVIKNNPSLPKLVRPIFRDSTDLTGGVLEDELKNGLNSSKYLIVVCSPRAAQSTWVCKEVQEFIDSGREKYIIPYIIEGEPNAKNSVNECFPKTLLELSGSRELRGININKGGSDLAAIKIVAHILGLQLDTLWERWAYEKRKRRRWIIFFTVLSFLITLTVAGVLFYQRQRMRQNIARAVAYRAEQLIDEGDSYLARKLLVEVLPNENDIFPYPYTAEAEAAMRRACEDESKAFRLTTSGLVSSRCTPDGRYILFASNQIINVTDVDTGVTQTILVKEYGEWEPISFSQGGRYLTVKCGSDIILLDIWDISKVKCVQKFEGVNGDKAEIIVDGKYVEYSRYGEKSLWEVETGKEVKSLERPCDFSPDAKFALTVDGKQIRILDIDNDKYIKTLNGHTSAIDNVIYSPNGEYIVSTDINKSICLWNVSNDKMEVLATTESFIFDVGFSPNGKHIWWVTSDNKLYVWSINESKLVLNIIITDGKGNFAFSSDGKYMSFTNSAGNVILYSLNSGDAIWEYNEKKITATDFTGDSKHIVLFAADGRCIIKPIEIKIESIQDIEYGDSISGLKLSPNGKYAIAKCSNGGVNLWSVKAGQCLRNFVLPQTDIEDIVFSDNEEYFVTFKDGTFTLWSTSSEQEILEHENRYKYNGFSFGNNDKYFVAWTAKAIELWSLETLKLINSIEKDNMRGEEICISNDGRYILYSCPQYSKVWSTDSMELINSFEPNNGNRIRMAKLNSKGDVVMSSNEKFIIWNIDKRDTTFQWELSGMKIDFVVGSQNRVLCYTNGGRGFDYYTPIVGDMWGRLTGRETEYAIKQATIISRYEECIVTLCEDNKIRIWVTDNMVNANCIASYDCNAEEVESITVTADGKQIFITTKKGQLKVLNFPSLQELIDKTREQFKDAPLTMIEMFENYLY